MELPRPEPAADRVRVRVEACGLNPVDWKVAKSEPRPGEALHIPGCDFVGIVDTVGSGVDVPGIVPGARVAGHGDLRQDGALAEYVIADPLAVALVPDAVDIVAAAALPCAAGTAYQSVIDRLHVTADDVVFVTGGGGAVGGFAVQLAARTGARVITTAAAADHDRVRALGASDLVDHRTEDVPARVLELTDGRGVDRIVDVLPAPSATENLRLLAHSGGIACVGATADLTAVPGFGTAPSLHEVALGAAHASGDERARRRLGTIVSALLELVASGSLDPLVADVVPFDRGAWALEHVRSGSPKGKVVVTVGETS